MLERVTVVSVLAKSNIFLFSAADVSLAGRFSLPIGNPSAGRHVGVAGGWVICGCGRKSVSRWWR